MSPKYRRYRHRYSLLQRSLVCSHSKILKRVPKFVSFPLRRQNDRRGRQYHLRRVFYVVNDVIVLSQLTVGPVEM